MNIFGCIFLISITLTLMFAGSTKILSYSNTINTIKKMGIFPEKIGNIIGVFMPIFEIIVAMILIIKSNRLVIILIIGYLLFFIALNLKYTVEKKEVKCCCYGSFIESKLGKAGLIHYLYILIILIIGYVCLNNPIINILNVNQISKEQILEIIILSFLLTINGFMIRSVIEKYGLRKW